MSGTLSSRFQGRFGYGPALGVGQYPGQMPGVTLPGSTGTAAPAPAAQPAQTTTPVAAGAAPVPAFPEQQPGDGPSGAGAAGMGSNPGTLGGGLSGFGVPSYGTIGGALGGLAGLAAGIPGAGLAGTAIGTAVDVNNANGQLSALGFAPSLGFQSGLSAFANNATFGLAGQSLADQMAGIPGYAGTIGMGAMGRSLDQEMQPFDAAQSVTQTADDIDAQNQSLGLAGYGYGTNPGAGIGSGNFGGMAAADRGEAVGPPGPDAPYGSNDPGQADPGSNPGNGVGDNSDGLMRGGYTGAGPDGVVQPARRAGTVHEGEVVIPAHQVARYGLPALMQFAQGTAPPSRLAAMARRD